MTIVGEINTGLVLGCPTYVGEVAMKGTDGEYYIAYRQGGVFPLPTPSVVIAQFANGVPSSTTIDFTRFNDDLISLGGPDGTGLPYGGFLVTTEIPVRGTPYLIVLATSDISNAASQFPVAGVTYRIDGPDTFTPLFYMHRICSSMDKSPSISRDLDCAAILNGAVYAAVCCGQLNTFSETHNTRLVGPLVYTEDDVDTSPSSWDSLSAALPFPEASSGSIFDMDTLQGTHVSITLASEGIGVFFRRNANELPFTIVRSDGSNTGETDKASAFGMPFSDDGLNWQGAVSGNASDSYLSPNVEADDGSYIVFARGFTDSGAGDGYKMIRIKLFSWDSATDTPTLISQTDFEFTPTPDMIATPRFVLTLLEDFTLNCVMCRYGFIFRAGSLGLPNPCDDFASDGCAREDVPCVTFWTQCWKIVRKDGVAFRFTALDRDFTFRGELYLSCGSLSPSAAESSVSVGSIQNVEAQGIITSDLITEADLYGGLFADARVDVWLVAWQGNESPRRLASGNIGTITHDDAMHKAEVLGDGARLSQQAVLEVFTPSCRWVFGSPECGKDITPFARSCSVVIATNRATITADISPASGSSSLDDAGLQWANGRAVWTVGRNTGQTCEVKTVDFDTGQIVFWALPAYLPEAGDEFELFPGCDQLFATCKDVYDNVINFGGFPDIPGDDSVNATPDAQY